MFTRDIVGRIDLTHRYTYYFIDELAYLLSAEYRFTCSVLHSQWFFLQQNGG